MMYPIPYPSTATAKENITARAIVTGAMRDEAAPLVEGLLVAEGDEVGLLAVENDEVALFAAETDKVALFAVETDKEALPVAGVGVKALGATEELAPVEGFVVLVTPEGMDPEGPE